MWQRLKNIFVSFSTYADLGPDIRMRRRVNRALRDRPPLSPHDWYQKFWQPLGVSRQVADFVYTHLPTYSGLEIARVQPTDSLTDDLQLPLVCWFDWELSLCEDFWNCFGVDVGGCFDSQQLLTVKELVVFLHQQQLMVNPL